MRNISSIYNLLSIVAIHTMKPATTASKSANIRVRFVTKYDQFRISEAPFAVPDTLGRSGLSEVVNHLLGGDSFQPFDFLIESQLLRTTLSKFLLSRKLSTETIIVIEYMPALTLSDEKEELEVPAWVGSLNCSIPGRIFAGCFDGQVQVLDRSSLSQIGTISAHSDPVTCVDVINGQSSSLPFFRRFGVDALLFTGSKDQSIKCFTVGQTQYDLAATFTGHMASVESLRYDSNRQLLWSGDWNGNLLGWDVKDLLNKQENDVAAVEGAAKKKSKSKSGKAVATVVAQDLNHSLFMKAHSQALSSINLLASGSKAFTSSWDHSVKLWDLETQDCLCTIAGSKVITSSDFSAVSQLVATSHSDGRVRLWDSRQADGTACVGSLGVKADNDWVSQVSWSPISPYVLASSNYMGKIRLWDTRASVPLGTSELHAGKAFCVEWAFDADSSVQMIDDSGSDSSSLNLNAANYGLYSGGSDCFVRKHKLCA